MKTVIRRVEYFHTACKDRPGQAFHVLNRLQIAGVNLFAFNVIPCGVGNTQFVLFPEDTNALARAASEADIVLIGPYRAFLVQGDDELGALAEIHHKLYEGNINVISSSGVTDGRGGYGYILYVRPEKYEEAAHVLGV